MLALDGTLLAVPDSTVNNDAFGKSGAQRSPMGYPQARVVAVAECSLARIEANKHSKATGTVKADCPRKIRSCITGYGSNALGEPSSRRRLPVVVRLNHRWHDH
ncbi:hypothetical protein ACFRU3_35965 [Streptomyces sp. NPDC056910]|uniref:hypothetical protein n=1 Tax=Streptomyces sp. NPDC056910 TaxID=3345964 RepID=UPI0036CEE8E9